MKVKKFHKFRLTLTNKEAFLLATYIEFSNGASAGNDAIKVAGDVREQILLASNST